MCVADLSGDAGIAEAKPPDTGAYTPAESTASQSEEHRLFNWRDYLHALEMLFGRVGLAVVILGMGLSVLAVQGSLRIDKKWLTPLLELAVTPIAVLISGAFASIVFLATRDTRRLARVSGVALLAAQVYIGFGACTVGLILVYKALPEVWLLSSLLPVLGIWSGGCVVLSLVSIPRLGLRLLDSVGIQLEETSDRAKVPNRFAVTGFVLALCTWGFLLVTVLDLDSWATISMWALSVLACVLSVVFSGLGIYRARARGGALIGWAVMGLALSLVMLGLLSWITTQVVIALS